MFFWQTESFSRKAPRPQLRGDRIQLRPEDESGVVIVWFGRLAARGDARFPFAGATIVSELLFKT